MMPDEFTFKTCMHCGKNIVKSKWPRWVHVISFSPKCNAEQTEGHMQMAEAKEDYYAV